MFGAPTLLEELPLFPCWEPGFGAPSAFDGTPYSSHDSGFGHPSVGRFHPEAPQLAPPPFAFGVDAPRGEYGDDGGRLLVLAAVGTFPVRGPYRVRVVDAAGQVWPPHHQAGCYSARARGGDRCYTNRSRERLSVSLPPLPQGAYALQLEWNAGLYVMRSEPLFLVVPAAGCLDTQALRKAFA